jgi:hypothetical protein
MTFPGAYNELESVIDGIGVSFVGSLLCYIFYLDTVDRVIQVQIPYLNI